MLVLMTQSQTLQDSGRERQLIAGALVDLSAVVASALVRRGVAKPVAETRERAVTGPTETGQRRRR